MGFHPTKETGALCNQHSIHMFNIRGHYLWAAIQSSYHQNRRLNDHFFEVGDDHSRSIAESCSRFQVSHEDNRGTDFESSVMKRHSRQVDCIQVLMRHACIRNPTVFEGSVCAQVGLCFSSESIHDGIVYGIDVCIPCSKDHPLTEIMPAVTLVFEMKVFDVRINFVDEVVYRVFV